MPNDELSQIEEFDARLQEYSDELSGELVAAVAAVSAFYLLRISQLPANRDGTLKPLNVTLPAIQAIQAEAAQSWQDKYAKAMRRASNGYATLANRMQRHYRALDVDISINGDDQAIIDNLSASLRTTLQARQREATSTITNMLHEASVTGLSREELRKQVENQLVGREDTAGRAMTSHLDQVLHDELMGFYRTIQLQKAGDADLDEMLYIGDIIADSRPFCVARVGRVFTVAQIKSWTHHWQGKSGPALTNCGGYNCRHHWHAVKREWLTDDATQIPDSRAQLDLRESEKAALEKEDRIVKETISEGG